MDSSIPLWERLCRYINLAVSASALEEAIQATSEFLERPFAVIDTAMNLIGYYPKRDTGDDDWDSLITNGRVSPAYVSITRQLNEIPPNHRVFHKCAHTPANNLEMEKYRCTLTNGTFHLGGAMILSDGRPFTPDDMIIMQVACQTFSRCLHDFYSPTYTKHSSQRNALSQLLDSDPHEALASIEKYHPDLYRMEGKTLIAGYMPSTPGDYRLAPYFQHILSIRFPMCQLFPYHENLVFLSTLDGQSYDAYSEMLQSALQRMNLQLSISDPFISLIHLKTHYENAFEAYQLGHQSGPKQALYTVGQYRLMLLMEHLSKDSMLLSLCHPAVKAMISHDAQHDTHYCKILRTYLTQFHNYSLAAQALFMHRNTLTYHLERIERLFDIDLDNPNLCSELLLSLQLLNAGI